MSHVCKGPVCLAASQSFSCNWNCRMKLTKYLWGKDYDLFCAPHLLYKNFSKFSQYYTIHKSTTEKHQNKALVQYKKG